MVSITMMNPAWREHQVGASEHSPSRLQVAPATFTAGARGAGWYAGRAAHIHVKVNVGGNVVHTGQPFFDETDNQAVFATAPYTSHAGSRTLKSQDNLYGSGGPVLGDGDAGGTALDTPF